ncbi:MAG: helix-turn-helix domain-containing protein [Bacteroidota bacterium]
MTRQHEIDRVPGLREILSKCQQDIEQLTNIPVTVFYRIKFHHLSTSDLTRIICEVCEVSWQHILSDSRKSHYVIARQIYCYLAYTIQKKSLALIGKILGRDHSTVIAARDKVITMKDVGDELYMIPLLEIERRIDEIMINGTTAETTDINQA